MSRIEEVKKLLSRLEDIWPDDLILIHPLSDSHVALYSKHPMDGGVELQRYSIRADTADVD